MPIEVTNFANVQELEVSVNGPNGADRMYIYTGTAVFDFKGTGGQWLRDSIQFPVGRTFAAGQFVRAIATAGLASIYNRHHAVDAGWAVDSADADWDDESGRVMVRCNVAISDSDGHLLRVSYIVHVLAKMNVATGKVALTPAVAVRAVKPTE